MKTTDELVIELPIAKRFVNCPCATATASGKTISRLW